MVMGGRKVGRFGVRIGVRMFSMEDRRRAVDLYFTEGMTIRKVVAKLGYPSEGALAKWVREDPRCTVPLAPDVYLEVQHPCWSCNSNSSSANASAGVR